MYMYIGNRIRFSWLHGIRRFNRLTKGTKLLFLLIALQTMMLIYVIHPFTLFPFTEIPDIRNAPWLSLPPLARVRYVREEMPWLSAPVLPRSLTPADYKTGAELLAKVHHVFEQNNLTFCLFYGSLVGSYIMHDIIPWDDDFDVIVPLAQKLELEHVMNNKLTQYGLQAHHHEALRANTYKISYMVGERAGSKPWNWPFIDLAFYSENSSHVWNMNAPGVQELVIPRDWFYPLRPRPFCGSWIPAPAQPHLILRQHYGPRFHCRRYGWNHKDETAWWTTLYTSCHKLLHYYPFVWRTRSNVSSMVTETLKLGGKVFYSVNLIQTDVDIKQEPFYF